MVETGATALPWVKAILVKEEHASRPESIGLGHFSMAEEWQNIEAYGQQLQQHQQRAAYQYAQQQGQHQQQRAAYQYAQQQQRQPARHS